MWEDQSKPTKTISPIGNEQLSLADNVLVDRSLRWMSESALQEHGSRPTRDLLLLLTVTHPESSTIQWALGRPSDYSLSQLSSSINKSQQSSRSIVAESFTFEMIWDVLSVVKMQTLRSETQRIREILLGFLRPPAHRIIEYSQQT